MPPKQSAAKNTAKVVEATKCHTATALSSHPGIVAWAKKHKVTAAARRELSAVVAELIDAVPASGSSSSDEGSSEVEDDELDVDRILQHMDMIKATAANSSRVPVTSETAFVDSIRNCLQECPVDIAVPFCESVGEETSHHKDSVTLYPATAAITVTIETHRRWGEAESTITVTDKAGLSWSACVGDEANGASAPAPLGQMFKETPLGELLTDKGLAGFSLAWAYSVACYKAECAFSNTCASVFARL